MKRGDIVTALYARTRSSVKTTCEGMIVYKKDNDNIGVNFGHYHIAKNNVLKQNHTPAQMLEALTRLGVDEIYTKADLTLIKKFEK